MPRCGRCPSTIKSTIRSSVSSNRADLSMAHIVPNEGKAKIHAFIFSQCADFSVVTDGGRRRSRTPQDSHLECDLELFGVTFGGGARVETISRARLGRGDHSHALGGRRGGAGVG